jgi:hypothetical protein
MEEGGSSQWPGCTWMWCPGQDRMPMLCGAGWWLGVGTILLPAFPGSSCKGPDRGPGFIRAGTPLFPLEWAVNSPGRQEWGFRRPGGSRPGPVSLSIPAVHFDLFLYDMRERNNRLFLRKYQQEEQLFSRLQWKPKGVWEELHLQPACPGRIILGER